VPVASTIARGLGVGLVCILACSEPLDKSGKPITHGSFRLRTFPSGARVWIDGILKVEQTPATLILKEGPYTLKIQHPGALATEKVIHIEAGKRKERTYNIPKPSPATLSVFSDVVGAKVRINGYVRGRTPLMKAITRPGPIDMTVIAPGSTAKSVKTYLDISEQEFIEVFFGDVACRLNPKAILAKPMSLPPPQGTLDLAFKPAGNILDASGKLIGTSPLFGHRMPVGLHKLQLRSENGKFERWVKIEIEADKNHVFRFRLSDKDRLTE
jgi:hypothetical protein